MIYTLNQEFLNRLALLEAGKIEDPYFGLNAKKLVCI